MRSLKLAVGTAFVLTFVASAGSVLAAEVAVAVLGIEASEGAPDDAAAALSDALRQKVAATKGWKVVPGRDLLDIKLVFSCPDEAPSCMVQAAKSLGANKLIFGGIRKVPGDNLAVTLKILDAGTGVVEAWVADQIPAAQAVATGLRSATPKWLVTLMGGPAAAPAATGAGVLRVKGDVPGASVQVDGVPSGVIGTGVLVIPGVAAGEHDVVMSKPGYNQVKKQVRVAPGETVAVALQLGAATRAPGVSRAPHSPPPAANPAPSEPPPVVALDAFAPEPAGGRSALRTTAWAVTAFGLLAGGLAIKFAFDIKATNEALDPLRRYPCPGPTGMCDQNMKPASRRTPTQQSYVNGEVAQGERFQTYQWISAATSGVLLTTGAVLFYLGYVARDDPATARGGPGVSILPVAYLDGGGGLDLRLRF